MMTREENMLQRLWSSTEPSIEDSRYKEHPKAYAYALEKTVKELEQAVEGMYHNLNTLN